MTDPAPSDDRFAKGRALAATLLAGAPPARPLPRDFLRQTMENVFGDVWQGDELALEERSLLTCTILTALGRENEQRLHVRGARNLGIPRAKIEAAINHCAYYAGWPVAVSAMRTLDEVWEAMDAQAAAT